MEKTNGRKFIPAKLPSNDYAFTGKVYLNPNDHNDFLKTSS